MDTLRKVYGSKLYNQITQHSSNFQIENNTQFAVLSVPALDLSEILLIGYNNFDTSIDCPLFYLSNYSDVLIKGEYSFGDLGIVGTNNIMYNTPSSVNVSEGVKLNITKPRKYTGKGYSIVKGSKPYKVMHYIDNKLKLYGYFKTEQEAIEAVNIIRNESNK